MLQAFDGAHVLRALEGSGIGATKLAHAALHLVYGFVFVFFHPFRDSLLDVTKMPDAMPQ